MELYALKGGIVGKSKRLVNEQKLFKKITFYLDKCSKTWYHIKVEKSRSESFSPCDMKLPGPTDEKFLRNAIITCGLVYLRVRYCFSLIKQKR